MNLGEEAREMTDADVLGHFETGDLLVSSGDGGGIAIVHAENTALIFVNADLTEVVVSPFGLIAAESDTGNVGSVVDTGEFGEGTPATAKVEHGVTGFHANLLTDDGQFVVLELLERFFLVDVTDEAGGVDHARAQEPGVEIITTIVMVSYLLLI